METARCFDVDYEVKKKIQKRFDKYPLAIRHCSDIKPGEKNVLMVLLDYMRKLDGWTGCFPSHATIAAEAQCSVRTVNTRLGALREKGFITWENRFRSPSNGYRSSNVYHLTDKILQYHPGENVVGFPEKGASNQSKKTEVPIPTETVRTNSANFADEFREHIYISNKHQSDDWVSQILDTVKSTEEGIRGLEKEKTEIGEKEVSCDFDATQQSPVPLEVAPQQPVDSQITMQQPSSPHWMIRPGDGKDQLAFRFPQVTPERRSQCDVLISAFVGASKSRGYESPQVRLFEYKQLSDMIDDIGFENSKKLMAYCVFNWEALRTSVPSASDREKLAHFPQPDLNCITAKWRYKMWCARMTGNYSERTRKKKAKEKKQIEEKSKAAIARNNSIWDRWNNNLRAN